MSLTETCLALAVVATSITVAAPSLIRARETYVLDSTARDVATRLYGARIHAITRNHDCRMRVESSISYVVECEENDWQLVERVALTHDLTITANARPEFHRRGNVSPTATITIWSPLGRTRRIVVNINGRIRIQ